MPTGIALLACTLLAIWFCAAVTCTLIELRTVRDRVLAWGLLAYAQAILATTVLTWFAAVTAAALAALHVAGALACGLLWLGTGRRPLLPAAGPGLRRCLRLIRGHLGLRLLAAAVVLAGGLGVFLVLYIPPNNWDAMTCHLARAAFWIQYQQVADYPSHNALHNDYPNGASILFLYTLIFTRNDLLVGFVQFTAWMGAGVVVFGMARAMRLRPSAALHAVGIALLSPLFLMQSTSAQIDLLFATVFGSSLYFGLKAAQHGRRGHIVMTGVALGLSFGTKGTIPLFMPLWIACVASWVVYFGWRRWRLWWQLALASAVAIALLGAEAYVRNLAKYGSPMNPDPALSPTSEVHDARQVRDNLIRCAVDACEIPFEWRYNFLPDMRRVNAIRAIGRLIGDDMGDQQQKRTARLEDTLFRAVQEDIAWFGFPAFLLLPMACLLALLGAYVPRDLPLRWLLAAGLPLAGIVMACIRGLPAAGLAFVFSGFAMLLARDRTRLYQAARWVLAVSVIGTFLAGIGLLTFAGYIGRYFLPMALLAFALVPAVWRKWNTASRLSAFLFAAIAIAQAVDVSLFNARKPLAPSVSVERITGRRQSVLGLPRERRRAVVRAHMVDLANAVEAAAPPVRRLGYVSRTGDSWDFPFFGPHLDRELVPLPPDAHLRPALDREELDYVLFMDVIVEDFPGFERAFGQIEVDGPGTAVRYSLWKRAGAQRANPATSAPSVSAAGTAR